MKMLYVGGKIHFVKVLFAVFAAISLASCKKTASSQVSTGSFGLTLSIVRGNNQTTVPNQLYSDPLMVRVTNSKGEGVEDLEIVFTETTSTGVYIPNPRQVTNSFGYASVDAKSSALFSAVSKVLATIKNTSVSVEFNLETSNYAGDVKFEIVSTHNDIEIAGQPFGFTVMLLDTFGNVVDDYNGSMLISWNFISDDSWANVSPQNLPTYYTCIFINGSCDGPQNIILTDSRKKTLVFAGDGPTGISDVFAHEIEVLSGSGSHLIVSTAPGGPDNGALPVAGTSPLIISTDDGIHSYYATVIDESGNYISDASGVTWGTDYPTEIGAYLTYFADHVEYTPTKSIDYPNTGEITADLAGHVQGSTGPLRIEPGAPAKVEILPLDGDFNRIAGEEVELYFKVLDAKDNIVNQRSSDVGYSGIFNLTFTFSDYFSDHPVSGGIEPQFNKTKVPNSIQNLDNVEFFLGQSSNLNNQLDIKFWDGTDANPKINVTITDPNSIFPTVTGEATFSVSVGPPHHIMLRNALGIDGVPSCTLNYLTPNPLYWSTLENIIGNPDTGEIAVKQRCSGLSMATGNSRILYAAIEDKAGNFIDNVNANWTGNSATSGFTTASMSPNTNTNMSVISPLVATTDTSINLATTYNGIDYATSLKGSVSANTIAGYTVEVREIRSNSPYAPNNISATELYKLVITKVDGLGNATSDGGARNITITTNPPTFLTAPDGITVPVYPPAGQHTTADAISFTYTNLLIPNAANSSVSFSVVDDENKTGSKNVFVFPGAPANMQIRNAAGAGGTNYEGLDFTMSAGTAQILYLSLFDAFKNFVGSPNGTWNGSGTVFTPSDAVTYSATGSANLFNANKAGTGVIRAEYHDPISNLDFTATTGTVTVSYGILDHLIVSAPTNVTAGVPFNLTVTLVDVNNNTHSNLNSTGSFYVSAVNDSPSGTGSKFSPGFQSIAINGGVAEIPVTLYNSSVTPYFNVILFDSLIASGNNNLTPITVKHAAFDHLRLAPEGLDEIVVGANKKIQIFAFDIYGNIVSTGANASLPITATITSSLATQDIIATNLSSPSNIAGNNDSTITGNLNDGYGYFNVTSNSSGLMTFNLTTPTTVPNPSSNLFDDLIVSPEATIDHIRWRVSPAPPVNHNASAVNPIANLAVEVVDSYGNVINGISASQNYSISLQLASGTGSGFDGTLTSVIDGGVALFPDIKHTIVEAIVLRATYSEDTNLTADLNINVQTGAAYQTVVLLPGQTLNQGQNNLASAVTGAGFGGLPIDAGTSHNIRVYVLDQAFNIVNYNSSISMFSTDPNASFPSSITPANGQANFNITFRRRGLHTIFAQTVLDDKSSDEYTVDALTAATQLVVLFDGQTLIEGAMNSDLATQGSTPAISPGTNFSYKVIAVDDYFNKIASPTGFDITTVTSDPNDINPAPVTMVNGEALFTTTSNTAGSWQVSVSDTSGETFTSHTSDSYVINVGTPTKVIAKLPGQTYSPGVSAYAQAITGTPTALKAGTSYSVTLYAVDSFYNIVPSYGSAVSLATPDDSADAEPITPVAFSSGVATFTIKPITIGSNQNLNITTGLTLETPSAYNVEIGSPAYLISLYNGIQTLIPATSLDLARTPSVVNSKVAGDNFDIDLYLTDQAYNVIPDSTSMVTLSSNSAGSVISAATVSLANGKATYNISQYKVEAALVFNGVGVNGTSPLPSTTISVAAKPASKILVKLPGQTFNSGQANIANVMQGAALAQTKNYPFTATAYATDDYGNLIDDDATNITLNSNIPSTFDNAVKQLTDGTVSFSINHDSSSAAAFLNTIGGSYTGVATPTYIVYGDLLSPVLSISDGTTASTSYARQALVNVNITSDSTAAKWCLSETQITRPATGTTECVGGTGPSNGWYSIEPTLYTFSAGQGAKNLYVWVSDAANNVSPNPVTTDSIIIDTILPATPNIDIKDSSTSSDIVTDTGLVDLNITGDTDATNWCTLEVLSTAPAPTAPLYNNACWVGARPSTFQLQVSGARKLYVFTMDIAKNVSSSFASDSITNNAATYFDISFESGTDRYAGTSFNLVITAKRSDNSTDTNFGGNKALTFTSTAANGNNLCGAATLTPTLPSGTYLFASGATTVNGFMLKKKESGVTISVTDTKLSGSLNAINVLANAAINCRRIVNAADGAGSVIASKTLAIQQSQKFYAAGYDAYGNFIADQNVDWSLSGAFSGYNYPTTNSTYTRVANVKTGSATLSATTTSDTVALTLSAGENVWTNTTQDETLKNYIGNNDSRAQYYWDVNSDATVAWRTDTGSSWYGESPSATRGSRADFPTRAYIVGNTNGLEIIDAVTNSLYMRFSRGNNYIIDSNWGHISSIAALNGKIFVGMDNAGTNGSLIIIDFAADAAYRVNSSDQKVFASNIADRNMNSGWANDSTYPALLTGSSVLSLHSIRIAATDFISIGETSGLNLLQIGGSNSIYKDSSVTNGVKSVQLTSGSRLYYSVTGMGVYRADLALPLSANFAASRSYDLSTNAALSSLNIKAITVASGTSSADTGQNTLLIGTDRGLSIIQEHTTAASSISKPYGYRGTGSIPAGNSSTIHFDGVNDYAYLNNALGIEKISTVEFWFRPDVTINSGSARTVFLQHGNPATNGSYGFTINDAGSVNGKIKFYVRHAGVTYTVFSTTTAWNKGQWYHVAGQLFSSNGLMLWVNGSNQANAAGDFSAFAAVTADLTVGGDGSNYFAGAIDELHMRNNLSYFATFTPTAPLTLQSDTVHLFRFNELKGTTAANAKGNGDLLITNEAWFAIPLLAGLGDNITGLDVNTSGANATAAVTTSGSSGSDGRYFELANAHTASPSVSSEKAYNCSGIKIYQSEGINTFDIFAILNNGGVFRYND